MKDITVITLIFSMLLAFFAPIFQSNVFAESSNDEEIDKLANQLEFLMEDAYTEINGKVSFDFEKIEAEFGSEITNEIKSLTVELEKNQALISKPLTPQSLTPQSLTSESLISGDIISLASASWGDCMISALKDHFGVALVEAALTGGLWGYLKSKSYKAAAKLLIKVGLGANAVTLASTILYYGGVCTWKHPIQSW